MDWIADHALLLLLSVGTAFSFAWIIQFRDRLHISWYAALVIAILHTAIGVLSVKVFAVLETADLSSAGQMSLFGGVFFMPVAYFVGAKLTKRRVADVFDVFTMCMIFTVMCARVNCCIAGCCLGQLIPGFDDVRWPTRQLEIVFYIILMALLWRKIRLGTTAGMAYPVYMASYGAFRFMIEFLREGGNGGIFHLSHLWAAIAFGVGISFYIELKQRSLRKSGKRK